jgi:glycine/D-amino acid oxidase-like deaminating enzyme
MSTTRHALRTGTPLWRAIGQPAIDAYSVDKDIRCEMAIVGGGITGALIGNTLAKAGVDTVIVDRDDLGIASTAASTGLLQYEIDTPLNELISQVGEANAVHAYRRGLQAIDEIEELVSQLSSDCGFRRRWTLCLVSSRSDVAPLMREWECRRNYGFDVRWLETNELKELSGFCAFAAMLSKGDAEIDPYQFTQELLMAARLQGARLFAKTTIVAMEESARCVTLTDASGFKIQAQAAVLCTGYLAHELLEHAPGYLKTTYVVSALNVPKESLWPEGFLVWETARPYFYARQTSQGHILIGGGDTEGPADHQSAQMLSVKSIELTSRFRELFPHADLEPDYVWAGTFAETKDGMPYIGKAPKHERIYVALGYGGNGITFGVIAARLICDLFLRRPTPDESVFRFDR